VAENGRKGIELFENEAIDLAIIDLRMPEMDGIEVLELITDVNPETPLIVFSGTGSIAHVVEAGCE
jgi:YesN/AraC family two-component response regulator